jgi:signal peptidase I
VTSTQEPSDRIEPPDPEFDDVDAPLVPPKKRKDTTRNIVEWVAVIGGALLLAFLIRTFLLAAFYIPSESMVATLEKGDRVLVNKLSYHMHDIHRGDVVVFSRPPNEPDTSIQDLIKRVIGLPGDTVEGRDGRIVVNGHYLDESYVHCPNAGQTTCTEPFGPITVPANQIFVMGDNRMFSQDSRVFGPISEHLVVGRAFVIVWPFTHIGWL